MSAKVSGMEHPKEVGDRTALAVIAGLRAAGYGVLVPFGENTRYDLVVDDGERLFRVQCKTGRLRDGAIRFPTCSSYAHHPNPKIRKRSYAGEVDYFGVHCRETGCVYLVPIDDVPTRTSAALRVEPPRNSQRQGIRDAVRYRVAIVQVAATGALAGRAGAAAPCA
jgi:hypothetical protein